MRYRFIFPLLPVPFLPALTIFIIGQSSAAMTLRCSYDVVQGIEFEAEHMIGSDLLAAAVPGDTGAGIIQDVIAVQQGGWPLHRCVMPGCPRAWVPLRHSGSFD
jgi:hypothetical protein